MEYQPEKERDRRYVRTCKTSADWSEYYRDYYNRDIKCNQKRSCTSSKESYHKDLEKVVIKMHK